MKNKIIISYCCILSIFNNFPAFSQTVINYQTWTGYSGCNIFSSPTNVPATGSYTTIIHQSTIGQPTYSATPYNAVTLTCAYDGNYKGTEYRMAFSFKKGNSYKITINAACINGTTANLRILPNGGSSGTSTQCNGYDIIDQNISGNLYSNNVMNYGTAWHNYVYNYGPLTSAQTHLNISAVPSFNFGLQTIIIRNVTIEETAATPTFTLPATINLTCGSTIEQTFKVTNVYSSPGISAYSWDLGSNNNGWLYNGNAAPQTITTGTDDNIKLTPECGVAQSSVTATVTVNSSNYSTNASTVIYSFPSYSISGPTSFCSGSFDYSITNLPCNAVVSNWIATPFGIVSISTSGNIATVTKSSGNGNVTLSATVLSCGSSSQVSSGSIAVGAPDNNALSIYSSSNTVCPNLPLPFVALFANRCNLLDAEWEVDPADANINYNQGFPCEISNNNTGATISFSSYGTHAVRVKVQNSCGWSGWSQPKYIQVSCGYGFSVSPNPASNTITVQSDQKTNSTITQLRIFDNNGILKKQSKFGIGARQAQMNVSDLKTGIYLIEISSGQNIERQQLVIQK